MTIEVGRRGLTPLATGATGGGGTNVGSSARPAGVPRLVTPPLANGVAWFEDFNATSVGPWRFEEGLVASPATIANQTLYGHPAWMYHILQGTGGQCGLDSDALKFGTLRLQTGTGSGDGLQFCTGHQGLRATTANYHMTFGNSTQDAIGQIRLQTTGGTTSFAWGAGWTASGDPSVDWVTNPLAAGAFPLTNASSIVFHMTTVAADSVSGTAKDVCAMLIETGVLKGYVVMAATGWTSGTWWKFEVGWNKTTQLLSFYTDGVLKGTIAPTGGTISASGMSFMGGIRNSAAAANRFLWLDSYYQELEAATAR